MGGYAQDEPLGESSHHRGHVEPGADSWSLDLGAAVVRKCSVSAMDNNVYLITCTRTGERLLIDAADEPDRISRLLAEDEHSNKHPAQILTTHRHQDHHRALAWAVQHTGATTLAGDPDAGQLPVPVDVRLHHGDHIQVGELILQVTAIKGHTPGSVAVALQLESQPTLLFTGDSLFPGGVGKTWSPADFASLLEDVTSRIFEVYDDDTLILPGHGDNTWLGIERPQLPHWRERGW